MITINSKAGRFFVPLFTFKLQSFKDIHWLKITGKCRDRRRHKDCESEQCVWGRTDGESLSHGRLSLETRAVTGRYLLRTTHTQTGNLTASYLTLSQSYNLTSSHPHDFPSSHPHNLTISQPHDLTSTLPYILTISQSHIHISSKALSLTISQHRHHIRLLISLCFQALFSSHMFSSPSAPSPCLMYRDKMLGMSLVSSK